MLTILDIASQLKVSRSYAYELVRREDFPRPVKIGRQVKRWIPQEVEKWIERQPRER